MHPLLQSHVFEIVAEHGCRALEVLHEPLAGYRRGELSNIFPVQKRALILLVVVSRLSPHSLICLSKTTGFGQCSRI